MHPTTRRKITVLTVAIALAITASIGTALAARNGGGDGEAAAKPGKVKKDKSGENVTPTSLGAPFTEALAFATKTGFRGVVTWAASAPVAAEVKWGLTPENLDQSLIVRDAPDTAGIAVIDGLTIGSTYYVTITDKVSGAVAGPMALFAGNAYNNYDAATDTYTLNALIQLDSQGLPAEIPSEQALSDIAAGVNVFAERVYDALDGNARLGKVVVADTQIAYAVNEPFGVEETLVATSDVNPCGADRNLADVLVQTTIPFDSHTFGWAIDEPCTSFYVGRVGQLVVPWEDDLHFGYVSTHEMMHYAFGAPDLYDPAETGASGCRNLDWDGSLMHNTGGWAGTEWELTELDRSATQTPCDTQYDDGFTWDYLQERYTNVPDGPIEHMFDVLPRGNEDGGALDIRILDRSPAASTLTAFTPDDSNPEILGGTCAADGRSTTFVDAQGDATRMLVDSGQPALSDSALDVIGGGAAYVDVDGDNLPSQADTITFTVDVDDLKDLPATASQGEYFDFAFNIGARKYYGAAQWDHVNPPTFELGEFQTTRVGLADNLEGTWDIVNDKVTFVVPAVIYPEPAGPLLPEEVPAEVRDQVPNDPAELLPEGTPEEVRDAVAAEEEDLSKPVFAAEPGAKITGLAVTSRRLLGVVVPDADVASGGCSLQLPGTPVTPPPPPPPPPSGGVPTEPSVTLAGGDSVLIEGVVPVTNAGYSTCVGKLADPRCVVYMVEVNPTSGAGILEFDITADSDLLEDFDVYLYYPDGTQTEVGVAGATGPADIGGSPVEAGRYYVQVVPYDAAAGSEFTLGLTLVSD